MAAVVRQVAIKCYQDVKRKEVANVCEELNGKNCSAEKKLLPKNPHAKTTSQAGKVSAMAGTKNMTWSPSREDTEDVSFNSC